MPTPRWIAEASVSIAEALYDLHPARAAFQQPAASARPTCGSARLLAPFAERGHLVFGIELDERLVPVATRSAGRDPPWRCLRVRTCDPYRCVSTATSDQPALRPVVASQRPLAQYELLSGTSIESHGPGACHTVMWMDYYEGGLLIA